MIIVDDNSPDNYTVSISVMSGDTPLINTQCTLIVDGETQSVLTTDADGKLKITLSKGAHYLKLQNSSNFVYVNNYSGTGVYFTNDGYYTFAFIVE